MSESNNNAGTGLMLFLLGAAAGALVVALTTPKSGPELRADLKDLGAKARDKARRVANQIRAEVNGEEESIRG